MEYTTIQLSSTFKDEIKPIIAFLGCKDYEEFLRVVYLKWKKDMNFAFQNKQKELWLKLKKELNVKEV